MAIIRAIVASAPVSDATEMPTASPRRPQTSPRPRKASEPAFDVRGVPRTACLAATSPGYPARPSRTGSGSASCGAIHDRDHNAAINLMNMAASSSATACGAVRSGVGLAARTKRTAVKQEPTHGIFAVLTPLPGAEMMESAGPIFRVAECQALWLLAVPLTAQQNFRRQGGSSPIQRSGSRAVALLRLAAVAVGRTDTALGTFYRHLPARVGKAKAFPAKAREIVVLFRGAPRHGMEYSDPGTSITKSVTAVASSPISREGRSHLGMFLRAVPRARCGGRGAALICCFRFVRDLQRNLGSNFEQAFRSASDTFPSMAIAA
jgi:hypothetical protein